ncbi:tyrosine-type recombinase/integrase, partial [Micrococcus sp. SIMBA_131]
LGDENIRKLHTIINDSLNKALKWGMIIKNPAALVDVPKVAKKEVEVWDDEEIEAFLEAAKDYRYYEAFLLALTTGMRQGEILGLRWKDIDE